MNYGIVAKVLGNILTLEALMLLPSISIALLDQSDDLTGFSTSFLLMAIAGIGLSLIKVKNQRIKAHEGLSIVALGWLLASLFGALPFYLSGYIPFYVDALFETISGFTTTGATILLDIESLPRSLLFWRSFTHWIGGMGILVFTVALLPTLGIGGLKIFRAESPGPVTDKIMPKIKDTAKILYLTYITISLAEILLLKLGGMSLYESAVHTFGTLGTGGFSNRGASIGAYDSSYIHVVISIFMILSGTNFALYFALYKRKWREMVRDAEWRFFLGIIAVATLAITINLVSINGQSLWMALRDGLFQVSSIITTTGYATVDFDLWPTFSKMVLFMLMFVGGSAGSTGGSIKVIRILIMLKLIKREVLKIFHPRAMIPVKVGGKSVPNEVIASITSFIALYLLLFIVSTLAISLEEISLVGAASAVAATLGNVGPGFEAVGPTQAYAAFSVPSKLLFSLLMLMGRLELFTIVALLVPKNWRTEMY